MSLKLEHDFEEMNSPILTNQMFSFLGSWNAYGMVHSSDALT